MKIVIVTGAPGSGKSYFAAALAQRLSAVHVNSDMVRKLHYPRPTYDKKEVEAVYLLMLQKLKDAIEEHRSLVLDATFHREERLRPFLDLLEVNGVKPYIFQIWAEKPVIVERVSKERLYSDADLQVYEKILSETQPINEPHTSIRSGNDNLEEMLKIALDRIYDRK